MGGNATKDFGTRRITKDEFNILTNKLKDPKYHIIKSYTNKESHGDIDVLGTISFDEFESIIKTKFNILGIVKNHNEKSYALEFNSAKFQLDYIRTAPEYLTFNYNYLSYNDLGNLIGRIASSFGFKFGHDGLFIKEFFDDKGNTVDKTVSYIRHEKLISRDWDFALEFLGLDPKRYKEGFNSLDDIFEYVCSSKYFHKNYYNLENDNNQKRTRDKKRENINKFNKYLESQLETNFRESRNLFKEHLKSYPQIIQYKRALKKEVKREYYKKRKFKAQKLLKILRLNYELIDPKRFGEFIVFVKKSDLYKDWNINHLEFNSRLRSLFEAFNTLTVTNSYK